MSDSELTPQEKYIKLDRLGKFKPYDYQDYNEENLKERDKRVRLETLKKRLQLLEDYLKSIEFDLKYTIKDKERICFRNGKIDLIELLIMGLKTELEAEK